jgi:hypothetical protein
VDSATAWSIDMITMFANAEVSAKDRPRDDADATEWLAWMSGNTAHVSSEYLLQGELG